jgi:hypothetical protein
VLLKLQTVRKKKNQNSPLIFPISQKHFFLEWGCKNHSTPLGHCLRFSFVLDRFWKFFDSVILGIMRTKYHKVVKGMMGSWQKAAMECKHLLVWWPFLNLGILYGMIICLSRNWTEILLGRANVVFLFSGFFKKKFWKKLIYI